MCPGKGHGSKERSARIEILGLYLTFFLAFWLASSVDSLRDGTQDVYQWSQLQIPNSINPIRKENDFFQFQS